MVFEVLWNSCKKGKCWFLKGMLSKFCKNPCSCFGYKLSYNHPNELIPIGKEPYEIGLQYIEGTKSKL